MKNCPECDSGLYLTVEMMAHPPGVGSLSGVRMKFNATQFLRLECLHCCGSG